MSTLTQPVPQPTPSPPEVPQKPVRRTLRNSLIAVLIVGTIVALSFGIYRLVSRQTEVVRQPAIPALKTVPVVRGTLIQTIRTAGEVKPVRFVTITSPQLSGPDIGRGLVLTDLAPGGSLVKKGQLVAAFDAQRLADHIEDVDAIVKQAAADIRKRRSEQDIEREELLQSVQLAASELEKMRLEAKTAELRTEVDRELLKLAVAEAEAQYKQLAREVNLVKELHDAQIRILEITYQRHELHKRRHETDYQRSKIYAPMDGMVVLLQIWRGGGFDQVKVGDMLGARQPFMRIVDPSSMQLEASISQVESPYIRLGARATVGLDAYPDVKLPARVVSIGALAKGSWWENQYIRRIPIVIQIEQYHERLLPGLSAYADIEIGRQENALIIPREALHQDGEATYVYVQQGESYTKRTVQVGKMNATQAAIVSGLSEGEIVLLGEPPRQKEAGGEQPVS